jgi:putative methyltransferase (TIGR04325 family)
VIFFGKLGAFSNQHTLLAQDEILNRLYSNQPFGISTDRLPGDDSFDFEKIKLAYLHLVTAYAVSRLSAHYKINHLKVLDFGGGVGNHLHICKSLLPWIQFDYSIVELKENLEICEILNPDIRRYGNLSDIQGIDFVHFGSSLQYVQSWSDILEQAISKKPKSILMTRTPLSGTNSTLWIENSGSMQWVFSKSQLISIFDKFGFRLNRNFDASDVAVYETKKKNRLLVLEEQLLFEKFDF